MRTRTFVGLISLFLLPIANMAAADTIEEVIVTAVRRESNVQNTGISIKALPAWILECGNITSTDEFSRVTPGLMFQNAGGNPASGLIAIRGVSQNDFAGHIESPNALYLDEAYQPSIAANSLKLFDVNRAEVVRGPQGIYFGRNATGGLLHLVTNKPTEDAEGYLTMTAGDYRSRGLEGVISGPLGGDFTGRLALFQSRADGWIDNAIGPDQIQDDTRAARVHLRYSPGGRLDVLLSAQTEGLDVKHTNGAWSQAAATDPVTGLGFNVGSTSNLITGYVDTDGDRYSGAFDQPGFLDRVSNNLTLKVSYDLGDMTLVSIGNLNHVDSDYLQDTDLTPIPFLEFAQSSDSEALSQELRLEETAGEFRWATGLYYLNIDGNYRQGLTVIPPPAHSADTLSIHQSALYTVDTTSWSVFGQMEYQLTDRLILAAGLRWIVDGKDYAYDTDATVRQAGTDMPSVAPLGMPPGSLIEAADATNGIRGDHRETGLAARLALDFAVNDNWLVYASFNKGYKAFNYNAGFAGFAPFAGLRFDGESLYAYEIGSKWDFWAGRGRWNISTYYYDYRDYQAFDQRGMNFTLFNTDATIKGMETELLLTPLENTTFTLGLALLDTRVEDVMIGADPAEPIIVDRETPQSPDFTVNAGVEQVLALGEGGGAVTVSLNAYYNDGYYAQLTNAANTRVPDYTLVNARISYAAANGRYNIAAFAKNLFDEDYMSYAFDIASNGFTAQVLGPPRWVGVELRFNY